MYCVARGFSEKTEKKGFFSAERRGLTLPGFWEKLFTVSCGVISPPVQGSGVSGETKPDYTAPAGRPAAA
jgi:hypothetical protein